MKRNTIYSLIISLLILSGCNNSNQNTETTEVEESASEIQEDMTEINLSEYGLEANIFIPDESKGKVEIQETSFGSIQIVVGKNYGIEIVPFGLSIAEKKEELNGDLVYNIEYITEEADLLEYKRTIKDSDVEEEYHFFYNKEIDGEIYEISSISEMSFKKFALKSMVNSAKSISTKNPA